MICLICLLGTGPVSQNEGNAIMVRIKYLLHGFGSAALVCVLVFAAGCTKVADQQAEETEEKGRIEQMTDEAADTAVKKIRTPINKARATKDYGNDRMEAIDKVMQKQ